jgi:hypothetical protein
VWRWSSGGSTNCSRRNAAVEWSCSPARRRTWVRKLDFACKPPTS